MSDLFMVGDVVRLREGCSHPMTKTGIGEIAWDDDYHEYEVGVRWDDVAYDVEDPLDVHVANAQDLELMPMPRGEVLHAIDSIMKRVDV